MRNPRRNGSFLVAIRPHGGGLTGRCFLVMLLPFSRQSAPVLEASNCKGAESEAVATAATIMQLWKTDGSS
jgi:hypothetical protein